MPKAIRKNEKYSEIMLTEGANTIVDEDFNYEMKLPEWVDEEKIKMGQIFLLLNVNAMVRALFYGLAAVVPIQTMTQILIFTKQSSTAALAYRRFKTNILHAQTWFQNEIKPGSLAWQSIHTIRRVHVVVNKRSTKAGVGIISQKDMALTQFLFMGFPLLMPDMFGIVGSYKQFDAYNHFWRLIGFLLGTEDRFNVCGETFEETQNRLQSIVEDMLVPAWKWGIPECFPYVETAFDGLVTMSPTVHFESMMFTVKRVIGVPGYHYLDSEASEFKEGDKRVYDELSFYTKFHIFLDFIIYEHLSRIFVFRWIFNIFRIVLTMILEVYPMLAIIRFGKKYAFVKIIKAKKMN